MAPPDWSPDSCQAYRLRPEMLEQYLAIKFGAYGPQDYEIVNDSYNFKVPRRLSQIEKDNELNQYRDPDMFDY
ncbi:hypothetical protein SLS57_001593 [Botryosphaeria dothidea]|uniref:Uncharacterized protein n=1 Tax=Botryosphaeria dothidea TaxID=55169 RepID=A0A8H4JB78_9PEZI|nr:hypothetical protein GTA08_BOTSDO00249 [Botryosphaeria dothidea]